MPRTTRCASCRHDIPDVIAETPFCPYCGERHPVVLAPPTTAAAAKAFSSTGSVQITFDAHAGFALFRGEEPDDEPPRFRAFDLYNQRIAWEALGGAAEIEDVDYESISVQSGRVYVGNGRTLHALDLYSGKELWRATLPDTLSYDSGSFVLRGPRLFDSAPAGGHGPVWCYTTDNVLTALDRDSGHPMWSEPRPHSPRRVRPFAPGQFLVYSGGDIDLVDAATQKVLHSVSGRIERADFDGTCVLAQMRSYGWLSRDGVLVHDFAAQKELLFEPIEHADDDVPMVAAAGHVYFAIDHEERSLLACAPKARPVDLGGEGFRIRALAMCGATLLVLLVKRHGTSMRRIVGVDPQTLAVRFELPELASAPNSDWTEQMQSQGGVAVISNTDAHGKGKDELVAVDAMGRTLWKVAVGPSSHHAFMGGHVVSKSDRGWRILRPTDGQVLAGLEGSRW